MTESSRDRHRSCSDALGKLRLGRGGISQLAGRILAFKFGICLLTKELIAPLTLLTVKTGSGTAVLTPVCSASARTDTSVEAYASYG